MTADQTKIAVIEERVNRHRKDIGRAFNHLDILEEKLVEDALARVGNEGRQTEMKASLDSLSHAVESAVTEFREVAERMGDVVKQLKPIVEEALEKELGPIKERITRIEEKEVDFVMIIKWLGTWRGVFFMCFIFSVSIGVLVPDAQDFIRSMFEVVGKAT